MTFFHSTDGTMNKLFRVNQFVFIAFPLVQWTNRSVLSFWSLFIMFFFLFFLVRSNRFDSECRNSRPSGIKSRFMFALSRILSKLNVFDTCIIDFFSSLMIFLRNDRSLMTFVDGCLSSSISFQRLVVPSMDHWHQLIFYCSSTHCFWVKIFVFSLSLFSSIFDEEFALVRFERNH